MRIAFVSWARYQSRSAGLAEQLGASMHFLHHGRGGHPASAPVRYLVQAYRTWAALRRERPEVVFVQNPPLPLVLLAYLYGRTHHAGYVIDSHTGAFLSAPWRRFLWLHRWLSRRALTTLVHNWAQGELVAAWDCPAMELIGGPLSLPPGEARPLPGAFRVLVVCSYAEDEPIAEVVGAARLLPTVEFYLSGDSTRMDPGLAATLPANCHCTGYVPYEEYLRYMRSVDVVMALTTRDGTLLDGASEALALRRPMILSDWTVLRDYYRAGAIHAPNTAAGLATAVRRAQEELPTLQLGIEETAQRLRAVWQGQFATLWGVLTRYTTTAAPPDASRAGEAMERSG